MNSHDRRRVALVENWRRSLVSRRVIQPAAASEKKGWRIVGPKPQPSRAFQPTSLGGAWRSHKEITELWDLETTRVEAANDRPEATSELVRFVDAIYFPKQFRDSGSLLEILRNQVGNRSNDISLEWGQAQPVKSRRRWILGRRKPAYEDAKAFRSDLAVAVVFTLLIGTGTGLQRASVPLTVTSPPMEYSVTSAPRPIRSPVVVPPEIRRDDAGVPLEIRASDPRSVLLGFCRSKQGEFCDPVELAWSDPPHANLRFGVFRGPFDVRAIEIRRDPMTGKWVAGNGRGPVPDFLSRQRRMSGNRIPVQDSGP